MIRKTLVNSILGEFLVFLVLGENKLGRFPKNVTELNEAINDFVAKIKN